MKKAIGCSAQVIALVVIVALLAAPLACIATFTAPIHSPELGEEFVCPPETRLVTEWYQASWNHPGEKTLAAYCVTDQGEKLNTLPQDEEMLWKGLGVYFPYTFIPLLVIGALILSVLNIIGVAVGSFLKKISAQPRRNMHE